MIERIFCDSNFYLENPGNGSITTFTDDGEQKSIERSDLFEFIESGSINNVQFWKTSGMDSSVYWKTDGEYAIFSLYVDGIDAHAVGILSAKIAEFYLTDGRKMRIKDGPAFSLYYA